MKEVVKNLNTNLLEETVKKLLIKGKGILAADESSETADKRLASVGIDGGLENRRRYRDLFLSDINLGKYVSGVILHDETFWQKAPDGQLFVEKLESAGVVPGIKVDEGVRDFPGFSGEKITIGLDDLPERVEKYFKNGARFAKWRAVFNIDEMLNLPKQKVIEANADALGRYARIVQEYGLVPIVEPEVLLLGNHSIQTSEIVTKKVVSEVFQKLNEYQVYIPGVILKTSMVINGNTNPKEASVEEVADATIRMLLKSVPKNVGGVVFLSGGQTPVEATAHLDAIAEREPLPFEISFSYARALQESALRVWSGNDTNLAAARAEFEKRLKYNQMADSGDYDIYLEFAD